MRLSVGARLGSYEVVGPLGVGGMGEVYRATDSNLKRQVAIKVLPHLVAGDADRLARFQREAEVLASLNHPNIAAIYGLERVDGQTALVLELVEGPTLADRLARGALPMDEALSIARQIAEAMEAAHEQGIVHRDLKPANIKVRDDGTVKVLDFGLAKLADSGSVAGAISPALPGGLSQSPTITTPAMTGVGTILGTAAYMSPEQAKGKTVDRRADIWAFGCVLYELLTGRQAFDAGESVSETIAEILKSEPDLTALPADTPASIRRLLRRCLAKEPRDREPHIGAARLAIKEAQEGPKEGVASPSPAAQLRSSGWRIAALAAFAAAILTAAALLGSGLLLGKPAPPRERAVKFEIAPPEGWRIGPRGSDPAAPHFAVSPDGERIVFLASDRTNPATSRLWVRRLADVEPTPLSGTDGAALPFWSPDGQQIAFFADGKLKTIDLSGGPPDVVCEAENRSGGTWNNAGDIVFGVADQLMRVRAGGGVPALVTNGGPANSQSWPQFLPDGRHFLYVDYNTRQSSVYVGSLDGGEPVKALENAGRAMYASGYLLYATDESTLMAQPFDPVALRTTGEARRIAEGVASNRGNGSSGFAGVESGILAYRFRPSSSGTFQLSWMDRNWKRISKVGLPVRGANALRLSPNDNLVALQSVTSPGKRDWHVMDLTRDGLLERLTSSGEVTDSDRLAWSPDSSEVVFGMGIPPGLFRVRVFSGETPRSLYQGGFNNAYDWSPDGNFVLFGHWETGRKPDLWTIGVNDGRHDVLVATEGVDNYGRYSPDGKWVAYTSDGDAYVRSASPGGSQRTKVAQSASVKWTKDGKELVLIRNRQSVSAIDFDSAGYKFGTERVVFLNRDIFGPRLDVSSDGERFLVAGPVVEEAEAPREAPLTIVVNWQATLK